MAIRKEEEKKNNMKITDNMDGEKKANEKLQAKYEPGVFDLAKYNKWKSLYESGGNMRKAGLNITKKELELFLKLYKKRN